MTRYYECLGCNEVNEVPFNLTMDKVEFLCPCGTINQAIIARPIRLAGTCKVWVNLRDYVDFFLGNRTMLMLTTNFRPNTVAANIQSCDLSMFIQTMTEMIKEKEREKEREKEKSSEGVEG